MGEYRLKTFKRHISKFEIATAGVIALLLAFAFAVQLLYGGNLWVLLGILTVCEAVFLFLILTPPSYRFEENDLVLVNPKPMGDTRIPYSAVVGYDTIGSFRHSQKDFDSIEVILICCPEGTGRKRTVSCHPENVRRFIQILREKCPDLECDPE